MQTAVCENMCVFVSIEQERVNESEREGERGGGERRGTQKVEKARARVREAETQRNRVRRPSRDTTRWRAPEPNGASRRTMNGLVLI